MNSENHNQPSHTKISASILKGRKVLFIAPNFYKYHINIIKYLEFYGASVDYFADIPFHNIHGLFNTINENLKIKYEQMYRQYLLKKTNKKEYDYVFIIRGSILTSDFIERISTKISKAKFILYQWDSLKNNNYLPIVRYFDKVFSFDRNDCIDNKCLNYLPLFFSHDCKSYKRDDTDIDMLFIGGLHGNRYEIVLEIEEFAKNNNLVFLFYLYIPFTVYAKTCILGKNYDSGKLKFMQIAEHEMYKLICRSRVVVDTSHENQSGLTMRTFESLALGRKLITTNEYIKYEEFYDPRLICIIDREFKNISVDFIRSSYTSNFNFNKYHISEWLYNILI